MQKDLIALRVLAYILGIFGVLGTLAPFIRYDDWWIRGFDYPRQQLIFILALAALFWGLSGEESNWLNWTVGILLTGAALYQAYNIWPYTTLHKKISADARRVDEPDRHLSLMVSNVLQTNKTVAPLIDLVHKYQPDILLTVETNGWWGEQLSNAFGEDYPHRVAVPLENLYGMHLWSRVPFLNAKTVYRIKHDIPGIDAEVKLDNGRIVSLYFVHPMPPSPSEAYASTGRDAELALVGKQAREKGGTIVVAGDLNDVAWSHSTRLFQRISGLLDPRQGRGLFSTFHADYRLARWPLDHVFHSEDLAVIDLERLPHIGSDHFPVYIKFSYEPEQDTDQGTDPDADDIEEANETIRHALEDDEGDTVAKSLKS